MDAREKVIEEQLRHILPKLENCQRIGKGYFLRLSVVELTAMQVVLGERVAELTIKRYSTRKETNHG